MCTTESALVAAIATTISLTCLINWLFNKSHTVIFTNN